MACKFDGVKDVKRDELRGCLYPESVRVITFFLMRVKDEERGEKKVDDLDDPRITQQVLPPEIPLRFTSFSKGSSPRTQSF